MKRLIPILVIMALLISLAGTSTAASTPVRVYVDGVEVQFPDQKPIINSDSRTLVPVRFVSEALGAEVGWDGVSQQVNVKQNAAKIMLQIGQKKARVGEGEVALDTAASLVNSRTMVPLRFVSECLGAKVEWMSSRQEVYIITNLPEAKSYQGDAYKASGLLMGEKAGFGVWDTIGLNMNVKVSELPAQLGSNYIIYDVQFGSDYISVKQWSENTSPCSMLIAEKGVITRQRNYLVGHPTTTFIFNYDVNLLTEQADRYPKPPVDIKNVSHVIFEPYSSGSWKSLTVANPHYKGE